MARPHPTFELLSGDGTAERDPTFLPFSLLGCDLRGSSLSRPLSEGHAPLATSFALSHRLVAGLVISTLYIHLVEGFGGFFLSPSLLPISCVEEKSPSLKFDFSVIGCEIVRLAVLEALLKDEPSVVVSIRFIRLRRKPRLEPAVSFPSPSCASLKSRISIFHTSLIRGLIRLTRSLEHMRILMISLTVIHRDSSPHKCGISKLFFSWAYSYQSIHLT